MCTHRVVPVTSSCAFVDKHRDEDGIEPICKTLQIGPSTYYARRSRPESARGLALGNRLDGPVQPDLPTAGKDLTGRPAPRQPRTTVEHHRQRGRTIRPAQIPPRPATPNPAVLNEPVGGSRLRPHAL